MEGFSTIESFKETITEIYCLSPFVEKIPAILSNVKIQKINEEWYLKDSDSKALPLVNTEFENWTTLSISKGKSFNGFCTYENGVIQLLSLWCNNQLYLVK